MSINNSTNNYVHYSGSINSSDGIDGLSSRNIYGNDIIETRDMERNDSQGIKAAPYCFCFCVFCK